jgi:hypothetical protein
MSTVLAGLTLQQFISFLIKFGIRWDIQLLITIAGGGTAEFFSLLSGARRFYPEQFSAVQCSVVTFYCLAIESLASLGCKIYLVTRLCTTLPDQNRPRHKVGCIPTF